MSFVLLDPGGCGKNHLFLNGAGSPMDKGEQPFDIMAYAACRKGGYFRSSRHLPSGTNDALFLLTPKNLRSSLNILRNLKNRGCHTRVTFRDSRGFAIANLLGDVTRFELFSQICREADGAIAGTPQSVSVFESARAKFTEFLPPPCPVDIPAWDFSQPLEKRRGIFIGTQSFRDPAQNHMTALMMADRLSRELQCPLAVFNSEGRRGGMILKSLRKNNPLFFILETPVDVADYLRVMALHRIVFQLDASAGTGRAACAALLCRIPCIGGNGATERLVFPGLSSPALRHELIESARQLLTNDKIWQETVMNSHTRAAEFLSFQKTESRVGSHH